MKQGNSGRYEFIKGNSRKFWEATWEGKTVIIYYGRIGTTGKTFKKILSTETEAYHYFSKKIQEKHQKGYKPIGTSIYPQSGLESAAICNTFVGEHTLDVAKGLCRWLTKCLKKKVSPEEFGQNWEEFMEKEKSKKVPGITTIMGQKAYWLEELEFAEDDLGDIYKKAVEGGADRFITFYNNAFVDIVAIKGKPTPREIALLVLVSEENVGDWTEEDTRHSLEEYK